MVIIDGYTIDTATAEEHTFDSEVTSYPVEEGADVTDHTRPLPIMVTVEGIVSDTPIDLMATLHKETTPSADIFERLQTIRTKREPVKVETTLRWFEDMVMTSLSAPVRDGDAFYFRAVFKQLDLVTADRTQHVEVPRAAGKSNKGHRPAKEIKESEKPTYTIQKAGNESWLSQAGNWLTG